MDIKDMLDPCLDFQVIKPKLGSQKREKQSRGKNEKPLSISIDLCSRITSNLGIWPLNETDLSIHE